VTDISNECTLMYGYTQCESMNIYGNNIVEFTKMYIHIFTLFHDVFKIIKSPKSFIFDVDYYYTLSCLESKEKKPCIYFPLFTLSLYNRLISGHEIVEKSMQRI
jgi:hypothetical protein